MRGLNDILRSYETYEGPETEAEYVKAIVLGFEYLREEIKGSGVAKINLPRIGTISVSPRKLRNYLSCALLKTHDTILKDGLEKLKNADRKLFDHLLSRAFERDASWAKTIRRVREIHEDEGGDALG